MPFFENSTIHNHPFIRMLLFNAYKVIFSAFSFFPRTAFLRCQKLWIWQWAGDQPSLCTLPVTSKINVYYYTCAFKVINCRADIIEMFVYQVTGSMHGTVIQDWKTLSCTKQSNRLLTEAVLSSIDIFTRRSAGVLPPSSQMGLSVKCHQVQVPLEIQWLNAESGYNGPIMPLYCA